MLFKKDPLILIFCAVYFIVCYAIAATWYFSGYFSVINVFFDTDPSFNIASFSHGSWGRHAVSHPLIEIFAAPIRILEVVFSSLGLVSDRLVFRELISLVIAPLFSSLTVACFYYTLKQIKLEMFDVWVFTLIFSFSFSNLVFAIVPETYSISGFLISLLIYYHLRYINSNVKTGYIAWFCLAILLPGITITNIFIFSLAFFVYLLNAERLSYFNAFKRVSIYSISALVLILGFYYSTHLLLDIQTGTNGGVNWVNQWITKSTSQAVSNAINFFAASINSFVGVYPVSFSNVSCVENSCNSLSFTRQKEDYPWLFIVLALLLFSVFKLRNNIEANRWSDLYRISFLIIFFNLLLHIVFGRQMFLYSQHWIVPLSLLLVSVLHNRRWLSVTILVVVIFVDANFLLNVDELVKLT